MNETSKILIQCDFDGTVTYEDASFAILETYIPGQWEELFSEYQNGKMTVGEFNSRVFAKVTSDKATLLEIVDKQINVREGFPDFIEFCKNRKYRIVFVSNGLDFYIRHILNKTGFNEMEVHASITDFQSTGLVVRHKGPDGNFLDRDVKETFTDYFKSQGYRIIYLGDGRSDIYPARKCDHVFATGSLAGYCREENLNCTPFESFKDVIREMEPWQ